MVGSAHVRGVMRQWAAAQVPLFLHQQLWKTFTHSLSSTLYSYALWIMHVPIVSICHSPASKETFLSAACPEFEAFVEFVIAHTTSMCGLVQWNLPPLQAFPFSVCCPCSFLCGSPFCLTFLYLSPCICRRTSMCPPWWTSDVERSCSDLRNVGRPLGRHKCSRGAGTTACGTRVCEVGCRHCRGRACLKQPMSAASLVPHFASVEFSESRAYNLCWESKHRQTCRLGSKHKPDR